jgi:hypothetical protein
MRALIKARQPERAELVAHTITDQSCQVHALTEIAGALAEAGARSRARRVVAALCSKKRWSSVAGVVLLAEPSAAEAVTL